LTARFSVSKGHIRPLCARHCAFTPISKRKLAGWGAIGSDNATPTSPFLQLQSRKASVERLSPTGSPATEIDQRYRGCSTFLAARLVGLALLVFRALALAPLIFSAPRDHASLGANAYNLTATGEAWVVAA